MDTVRPITVITANGHTPYALVVGHTPITDSRLSLADLGLYVRCLWLREICGEFGDVDWFIQELDMPAEETRAGLLRLVSAGYLSVPGPEFVEAKRAHERACGVRTALEQAREQLSEDEAAAVDRFVGLAEEHAARMSRAAELFTMCEIEERQAPEAT